MSEKFRKTVITPIPGIPQDCPVSLSPVIDAVKVNLETGLGERSKVSGLNYDQWVRIRDLCDRDFWNRIGAPISGLFTEGSTVDKTPPGAPTNFTVTQGVWSNFLSWTNPSDEDFAYVEVWGGQVDDVTQAILLTNVSYPAHSWTHTLFDEFEQDWFYWIRSVDFSGNVSDFTGSGIGDGGIEAPGKNTVGEMIDAVMDTLDGYRAAYAVYNASTGYFYGDRVIYALAAPNGDGKDRTYKCVVPGGGSITGQPPLNADGTLNNNYWVRSGILIEGDVDGIATVGIDGNAVVDGTLLARCIKTDKLSAIVANLGEVTAGQIVVGNSSNKLWLNDGNDGGLAVGGTVKADAPFHLSGEGLLTIRGAIVQSPSGNSFPVPCYLGAYSATATYYRGDVVVYGGVTWIYVGLTGTTEAQRAPDSVPADDDYWDPYTESGQDAQYVTLSGEQVYKFASGASTPTPDSITLTATLFGGLTDFLWQYYTGSAWANLGGTVDAATYALAHDNPAWGEANTLRVRCLSGTVWDEITLVKLYDGAAGVTLKLSASSQVFQVAKDGTASPTSITFTAIGDESLSGDPTFSVVSGTATLTGTGTTRYLAYTGLSTDAATIRITWDGLTDEVTVVKLREGSDAYTALLTNEAAVLAATSGGTVADFAPAAGEMKVWKGAAELTSGVTYSKISNTSGLTIAINSATGVYTVTGMTVDTAIAVFQAAVTGGPTIQKTYSISKGKAGLDGLSVAELYIYKRSATELTVAPTAASSYNFSTQILTPPSGWSTAVPSDSSHPVYICVGIASITGTSGIDSAITWSAPVKGLADGSAVDIIFKRNLTQPATPAASSGVPSGWVSDVNSVPASEYLMWSCVGTRANASENWIWQTPVQVEGFRGVTNLGVPEMNREVPAAGSAGVWSAAWFNEALDLALNDIGWTLGAILSVSAMARCSVNGYTSAVFPIFYKADGFSLTTGGPAGGLGTAVSNTTNLTNGYARVFRSVIPPDDAVYMRVRVQTISPYPSTAYTIYGKDAMVYLGPGEQPYVPCVRDSKSIEYIFNHSATSTAPSLNTTAVQTDGYVPSGWSDDPSDTDAALSASYPYQWVSSRTKGEDGQWSVFAAASLWATYSTHGYTVLLTNESHTVACDAAGAALSGELGASGRAITDVVAYKKTDSITGTTDTTPGVGYFYFSITEQSGCTAVKADANTFYLSAVSADSGYVEITVLCESTATSIKKRFSWSKSKTGATGATGANGADGADGADGPGLTFRGTWAAGIAYVGTAYVRDVVYVAGTSTYYRCVTSHTSTSSFSTDLTAGKWVAFGASFESVATNILLAQDVTITKKLTFTGTNSRINVTGASGLTINSAGGLAVNSAGGLVVNNGGGITINNGGGVTVNSGGGVTVNAGGDITLVGADSNPGKLVLKQGDATKYTSLYADYSGAFCMFQPSSNNSVYLLIGGAPSGPESGSTLNFKNIYLNSYGGIYFAHTYNSAVKTLWWKSAALYSIGTCSLGNSTAKWSEVWATNGTIQTSDETEKDSIAASDLGLDFINQLSPKKWIWKNGKRPHYGLISQEVGNVLEQRGHDFAGYIKATNVKVKDDKGQEVWVPKSGIKEQKILEEKESYHIRYHEFIGPLIKAVQELTGRIMALEKKE